MPQIMRFDIKTDGFSINIPSAEIKATQSIYMPKSIVIKFINIYKTNKNF